MISDPGQFEPSQKSKAESHLNISFEILLESVSSALHGMKHHKLDKTLLIDIRLFSEIQVPTSTQATSPLVSIVARNSRRMVIAVLVQVVLHLKIANTKTNFLFLHHSESHLQNICVETHEQRCAMRDSQFSRLSCILHT